ncbi:MULTISPECIES: S8 family serine peptidase [unclassified Pseudoalteromonas]|uniref:S8 family serine peptidase n=1 Tax=unclassified Pseudoalteromonas TaxID=194690 RepID=UPI0030142567
MNNNKFKHAALSTAIVLALTACGGGSDNNNTTAPEKVDTPPTADVTVIAEAKQWHTINGKLEVSDADGDPLSYSFFDGDTEVEPDGNVYSFSHGTLTLNGTNSFSYIPLTDEPVTIDFTVTANGQSANGAIEIANMMTDPLANQQWHLNNTGQKAYSLSDETKQGLIDLYVSLELMEEEEAVEYWDKRFAEAETSQLVSGEDMNVIGAYSQGVTGAGVTAVVVDSGLEIRHEDLQPNVVPNRSLNLNVGALDKTDPTSDAINGDHGTSVAGLIASKGWNGLGGRGVAPDTGLIGMNNLNGEKVEQMEFLIHGFPGSGITADEPISVFNRSYGLSFPTYFSYSEFDEKVESYPNLNLRSGKGAINIKSSGNDFEGVSSSGSFCADNGANDLGLTCYNGNGESSQAHPYYFSVGAVNANGKHTSYSTAGANLLASAPAGEYGRLAPAMITTDPMTCLSGASGYEGKAIKSFAGNYGEEFAKSQFTFDFPGHPDNPNCNYRSTMNGTSSAAPNTSGVVSLILSANQNLTWRDVRHIIASTSTQIDADNEAVELEVGEGTFVAHSGWVENAAGFTHNNLYGFGRVDAGAAVTMAKSYNANLGEEVITDWVGKGTVVEEQSLEQTIPDFDANGTTVKVTVDNDINVEAIQFKFDVSNEQFGYGFSTESGTVQTTAGSDLAIEVTSPSGTRSVLLSSHQALLYPAYSFDNGGFQPGYILKDGVFLSNAFYGESAKGEWTIRLLDADNQSFAASSASSPFAGYFNNQSPSILMGAAVRVFGHNVAAE